MIFQNNFLTTTTVVLVIIITYITQSVNGSDDFIKDISKHIKHWNAGCPHHSPIIRDGLSPNGDSPTEPIKNMVRNAGYVVKTYKVTTQDGYILTLFRISKHRLSSNYKNNAFIDPTPVLLLHGILSSPADYLVNNRTKALPYKLVEDGKDVWLGANRGTTYSLKHKTLTIDDPEFWKFSHVEFGLFDLPAFMDTIEDVTNQEQVYIIGHSVGSKEFFSLMSLYPGNCSRVKAMWALAPTVYLKHMTSPPAILAAQILARAGMLTSFVGGFELLPNNPVVKTLSAIYCSTQLGCPLCENFIYLLYGYDNFQVNKAWQAAQVGHAPDSTSNWNMIHQAQEYLFDRFGYIDLGPIENAKKYGAEFTFEPPQFEPQKIGRNKDCNIHLIYAENDALTNPKDVKRLRMELGPAVKSFTKVNYKEFSHIDFLWGKDVDKLVYNKLLTEMNRYS